MKKGANAVINAQYERGISFISWKALTAKGTAVIVESDEIKCPFCAEIIRREAIKCRHCGADLPRQAPQRLATAAAGAAREGAARILEAAPAQAGPTCSSCGAAVQATDVYCESCGARLGA